MTSCVKCPGATDAVCQSKCPTPEWSYWRRTKSKLTSDRRAWSMGHGPWERQEGCRSGQQLTTAAPSMKCKLGAIDASCLCVRKSACSLTDARFPMEPGYRGCHDIVIKR
mmetsp:Transcript_19034/g.40999  ORF Transcript_19034/g.40999 Transcript_19034/m.40999 type:complete len:110 (-) Transcript_19034:1481-1810(-)